MFLQLNCQVFVLSPSLHLFFSSCMTAWVHQTLSFVSPPFWFSYVTCSSSTSVPVFLFHHCTCLRSSLLVVIVFPSLLLKLYISLLTSEMKNAPAELIFIFLLHKKGLPALLNNLSVIKSLFYTVMSCWSPWSSASQRRTAFHFFRPKFFFLHKIRNILHFKMKTWWSWCTAIK